MYSVDLKRLAEGSGNVDAAGNFSIEVLRAALKNQFDLSLVSIQAENLKEGKSGCSIGVRLS